MKITVCPKGFGSENMSRLQMLTPASGREDIIRWVVDAVSKAGSNPCPPMVLGVGIGGNFAAAAVGSPCRMYWSIARLMRRSAIRSHCFAEAKKS